MSEDKGIEKENESEQGGEGSRVAHIHPGDKEEVQKALVTFESYKSLSHLLWSYLTRSLIPRIERGSYCPRRLATEVAGRNLQASARDPVRLGRADWEEVRRAAETLNEDLRHLEEKVAWSGSLRGFPFCRCGPEVIVRAGAREIAAWSRRGISEAFSREPFSRGLFSRDGLPEGDRQKWHRREEGSAEDPASSGPTDQAGGYQVMRKLPGAKRGGKPVQIYVTPEAKRQLKRKAKRLNQDGSDLARRGVLTVLRWVEEAPTEAVRYIQEESDLYQPSGEKKGSGFQVYLAIRTKRRVEQATGFLGEGFPEEEGSPGEGSPEEGSLEEGPEGGRGRPVTQQEILQAAARLAIESPDEDMLPPLPGAEPGR